ncbi:MAG: hypothetical protein HYY02_07700 [Chloroflexi bacterium]|nr:hypothetical protein [Chloroflexota bacterium]
MGSTLLKGTVGLGSLLLLAVIVIYPSSQDLSPDNPYWNGLNTFGRTFSVRVAAPQDLSRDGAGAALVLIPRRELSAGEQQEVRRFVASGGELLLMDDFAYGNRVLEHLGVPVRFSDRPVLDPLVNEKNQWFPKAFVSGGSGGGDAGTIVLDQPSSLTQVSSGRLLASSSRFSFQDLNENGVWDPNEPSGPFPMAAEYSLGDGKVVVVADPSILINGMMEKNEGFVRGLLENRRVLLYAGNLPSSQLEAARALLERSRELLATPLGLFTGLALAFVLANSVIWRNKGE